jgi:hypothetical protein
MRIPLILALAAMSLSAAASTARPAFPPSGEASPGYAAGSQYTASFDQSHNRWRLQPADGQDVEIDTGACATGAMIPAGVWLVVRDARGRPELLAPSVTRLPAGSPDRIALRDCGEAQGRSIAVPRALLEILGERTGAVYVYD